MRRERAEYIRGVLSALDGLPDGAFLAAAEEMGVSVDDLAELSKIDERLSAPPPGTHICGGSWERMPDASRREVWAFYDKLVAKSSTRASEAQPAQEPAPDVGTPGQEERT